MFPLCCAQWKHWQLRRKAIKRLQQDIFSEGENIETDNTEKL